MIYKLKQFEKTKILYITKSYKIFFELFGHILITKTNKKKFFILSSKNHQLRNLDES